MVSSEAQERFASELARQGIDIVHPLDVRWYNAHVAEHGLQAQLPLLPDYGRRGGGGDGAGEGSGGALAILLGNTKALWPCFLDWLGAQRESKAAAGEKTEISDPLDSYTGSVIRAAVATLAASGGEAAGGHAVAHDVFWSWEKGDRLVSMQRVAVASGLCYHDGETQLAIHPTHGAWVCVPKEPLK